MNTHSTHNSSDQHDDQLMEHVVDMMEEGHQLTEEEQHLLLTDDDAARAYKLLGTMKGVVESGRSALADDSVAAEDDEEDSTATTATSVRALWLWLAAAAAVLGLAVLWLPRLGGEAEEGLQLVYEEAGDTDGVLLTIDEHDTIDLTVPRQATASTHRPSLTQQKGQLILDYQALRQEGVKVADKVQTNTVEMTKGRDFKLVLCDGTEVWLYAASRLVYPSLFVGKERRVYLKGEAYFRVAKDAKHPFVVVTDRMEARVLGTELNVCCRQGQQHVALITGSVEVTATANHRKALLTPGCGATLTDGNDLRVAAEDMDVYTFWRDGYVYFDDAPLLEVAEAVGRWFNVNVFIDDEHLSAVQLHFLYKRGDTLAHVLSMLNNYGLFRAERQNGGIVFSPPM